MYPSRVSSHNRAGYQSRPSSYYERQMPAEREQLDDFYQSFGDMRLDDTHRREMREREDRRRYSRPPPAYERLPETTRRFSHAYEDEYGRPAAGPSSSRLVYSSAPRREGNYAAPQPVGEYSGMREPLPREEVDAEERQYERHHMRPRGQTLDEPWVYRRPVVAEVLPSRRLSARDPALYLPRDWHESRDPPFEESVPVSTHVRAQPCLRNFSRPIGDAPGRSLHTGGNRVGEARQASTRTAWCSSDEEEETPQSPRIETPRRTLTNPRSKEATGAGGTKVESQPSVPPVGIYINTGHQENHQSPPPRTRGTTSTSAGKSSSSIPSTTTIVVKEEEEEEEDGSSRERRRRRRHHHHHHANEIEEPRERDSTRRSTRERERSSRHHHHHTSDEPSSRHKSSSSRRKSTHAAARERDSTCIPQ